MIHKHYSLLCLAGIIYANTFAQPVIKAQRAAGGSSLDLFKTMCLTIDGGLIAGGSSFSNISGQKTENSRGDYDYWIVKYDSLRNIQWDKTIGGNSYDALTSIQQTSDGGYIMGGHSYSNISGEKTENNRDTQDYSTPDYWVVKLDSNRNIQWDKTIGGNSSDYLYSILQTTDGGYILGGWSESNISGEKTQNRRGDTICCSYSDYWIIKLDGNGKIEWDKTIGGDSRDDFSVLQQTSDGGYILGGYSSSNISNEKTDTGRGFNDYWIVKLSAAGQIQWDKTIGGDRDDPLLTLQQASDGGYILGGHSKSNISGEKTQRNRDHHLYTQNSDYWVVKLNGSGNIEWDRTIGGNANDVLVSLQQTIDGGYILGGYSNSNISGEKTENNRCGCSDQYNDDYWIVKLTNKGRIQWDKTIGGTLSDGCYSVKELGKNRYVAGGYSRSEFSGDKKIKSRGYADYWLVGLFNKTGSHETVEITQDISGIVSPNTNKVKGFIVYPNPAKNSISINYRAPKNGKYIFEITGITGNILLRKEANAMSGPNRITLDVSRFHNGVYFINITRPDKTKESIQLRKE